MIPEFLIKNKDYGTLFYGAEVMKYFKPRGGRTRLLWRLAAPFITARYVKQSYFTEILPRLEKALPDTGMTRRRLYRDICYSEFAFGCTPSDYFDFDFYRLNNNARSRYTTTVGMFELYPMFNDLSDMDLFDDKVRSAEFFGRWYRREYYRLESEEDIPGAVEFMKKHGVCLLKPLRGGCGDGIRLLKLCETPDIEGYLRERLGEDMWILDEKIVQHPVMNAVNPSSVNTVRIHTVLSKGGRVKIVFPYLRMGRDGSVVDNYCAGGVTGAVDPETGNVFGVVFPNDGKNLLNHPTTGTRVVGMTIPHWDKALKMAEELARTCPKVRLIGWDFALAEDGEWTLVEANCLPGPSKWEMIVRGGHKKDFLDLYRWSEEN